MESAYLKIKTFKGVFIKCKILIFFYFSKMQQKCFMLYTIQPFAESLNPDGNRKSFKHIVNCSLYTVL